MAKLTQIVRKLSEPDYTHILSSLKESNAGKSVNLLIALREQDLAETDIAKHLGIGTNAYYTLRSRLSEKIEDFLLRETSTPRTDLLRRVASIHELVYLRSRPLAIAALKKLEKELMTQDLAGELTTVYKILKKLHQNRPEYYTYSQLYNRQVAYMLSLDKSEDIMADFFNTFGQFALSGQDTDKLKLEALAAEMENNTGLYDSHRQFVYSSSIQLFNEIFLNSAEVSTEQFEELQNKLDKLEEIINTYSLDPLYYHLHIVIDFHRLVLAQSVGELEQQKVLIAKLTDEATHLLEHYSTLTCPWWLFELKMNYHCATGTELLMYKELENSFDEYNPQLADIKPFTAYSSYKIVSSILANKPAQAAKLLFDLFNKVSYKKLPHLLLELKLIQSYVYLLREENELFKQSYASLQRHIKVLYNEEPSQEEVFLQMLKEIGKHGRSSGKEASELLDNLKAMPAPKLFSPLRWLISSRNFTEQLKKIEQ